MSEQTIKAAGFEPKGLGCGDGPHTHDVAEAAALLGIGESTLRKRVAARLVPFTFPAGLKLIRFTDDDLRQILAAGSRQPRAPRRGGRTR